MTDKISFPGAATATPTALFDYSSPEFQHDPWVHHRKLRAKAAVHYSPAIDGYVVVTYDEVKTGLGLSQVGAGFPLRTSRRTFGRNMLDLDGAERRRFRRLVTPALDRKW
jgi:cytochrome P450